MHDDERKAFNEWFSSLSDKERQEWYEDHVAGLQDYNPAEKEGN